MAEGSRDSSRASNPPRSPVPDNLERADGLVLANGLANVEGPVLAPNGWVLNVCSLTRPKEDWPTRGGDIVATHPSRARESYILFNTSTADVVGIPAALAFGPDEALYITDEGRRAIVRVDATGAQSDFVFRGIRGRLNGPNDLVFDKNGNLFFSDPWTSSLENPIGAVFGYDWTTKKLHEVDSEMAFPNGVVLRGQELYVAETLRRKIWVYELEGDGKASRKRLYCELPDIDHEDIHGPDGMAFDVEGNLYVAYYGGSGVYIFDTAGALTEILVTPGVRPTNLCFGGAHHRSLYVTIDDLGEIVEFRVPQPGAVLNFCPSRSSAHRWGALLMVGNRGAAGG